MVRVSNLHDRRLENTFSMRNCIPFVSCIGTEWIPKWRFISRTRKTLEIQIRGSYEKRWIFTGKITELFTELDPSDLKSLLNILLSRDAISRKWTPFLVAGFRLKIGCIGFTASAVSYSIFLQSASYFMIIIAYHVLLGCILTENMVKNFNSELCAK